MEAADDSLELVKPEGAVLDPVLHLVVRRGSADIDWQYRGDNFEIFCQAKDTAAEVKGQIEEQSGLPAHTFKLLFNGQVCSILAPEICSCRSQSRAAIMVSADVHAACQPPPLAVCHALM